MKSPRLSAVSTIVRGLSGSVSSMGSSANPSSAGIIRSITSTSQGFSRSSSSACAPSFTAPTSSISPLADR